MIKKFEEKHVIIIVTLVFAVTVILFFTTYFRNGETPLPVPEGAIEDCEGVLVDERDGNEYEKIKIGDQCWFAENLRVSDLESLEHKPERREWEKAGEERVPAYVAYGNDPENVDRYGYLYNLHAVEMTGLCPEGWSVPSDEDWHVLESYLSDTDRCRETRVGSLECDPAGAKMKALEDDGDDWNVAEFNCAAGDTHECIGFNALPGGSRYDSGTFFGQGAGAFFWVASETGTIYRNLRENQSGVLRNESERGLGMSVRCTREKE